MTRRRFLLGALRLGVTAAVGGALVRAVPVARAAPGALDATALTEVFGDGLRLTAVAVRYDRDVSGASLTPDAFAVADRAVVRVYAADTAAAGVPGRDGRFVIVELSPDDAAAKLWNVGGGSGTGAGASGPGAGGGPPAAGQAGPAPVLAPAVASVRQVADVRAVDGSVIAAGAAMTTSGVVNAIVDAFTQDSFTDPATGTTLDYNLFVPAGHDPSRRYPLVVFLHDASVVGAATVGPLVQGRGAVSWASPADQAREPCFVLAPQYPTVVIDDVYQPTPSSAATVALIEEVTRRHAIDPTRRYGTGQSMGAMMTIGLNLAHPHLFAASYIVAGQWPAEQTAPLAADRLWITVSQGDTKAYPGENAITELAERNGATVARAVWDARATPDQFANETGALVAQGAGINYVAFAAGTTLAAGETGSEHTGTWRVAYDIPGIREWVLRQR